MKKLLTAAIAAALCVSMLCACGDDHNNQTENSEATRQGNQASFNISTDGLKDIIKGAWVNQDDLDEKIKIGDDLSLTYYQKADKHEGTVTLDEKSGMLTVKYDDTFCPVKTYIWVDSKSQLSANTWYVDGGTFAFGNTIYIKDYEI